LQFRVLKIPLFSEKIGIFSRIFQEKYCTLSHFEYFRKMLHFGKIPKKFG